MCYNFFVFFIDLSIYRNKLISCYRMREILLYRHSEWESFDCSHLARNMNQWQGIFGFDNIWGIFWIEMRKLGIRRTLLQGVSNDTVKYDFCSYGIIVSIQYAFKQIWNESKITACTAIESILNCKYSYTGSSNSQKHLHSNLPLFTVSITIVCL